MESKEFKNYIESKLKEVQRKNEDQVDDVIEICNDLAKKYLEFDSSKIKDRQNREYFQKYRLEKILLFKNEIRKLTLRDTNYTSGNYTIPQITINGLCDLLDDY